MSEDAPRAGHKQDATMLEALWESRCASQDSEGSAPTAAIAEPLYTIDTK
jgi:hypothetical protein